MKQAKKRVAVYPPWELDTYKTTFAYISGEKPIDQRLAYVVYGDIDLCLYADRPPALSFSRGPRRFVRPRH